ncbi:MAG: hypothetical protein H0V66_09800 [Bdellovibrionales bacterium]|nr:hypothetical protein [Bdellovibrionales bacterium]
MTLFLLILSCLFGVILWITLSGALLVIGLLIYLLFIVISIGYTDTAILFFLGAREVRSADEADFHAAAVQEAYKLAVGRPRLYYYNGALERAFVLQNQKTISLVLSKDLLEICSKEELAAICFELLLQVKKNVATKRTKVMFIIGMATWFSHGCVELLIKIVPIKEFRQSMNWLMYYLLHPWLELTFKMTLGDKYFKKLDAFIKEYPNENDLLKKVGSKLRTNNEIYSLSSRKLIEFSSVNRSRHYQNIITLEFLPHEWDLIFDSKMEARV